jgi:hypothetical protein
MLVLTDLDILFDFPNFLKSKCLDYVFVGVMSTTNIVTIVKKCPAFVAKLNGKSGRRFCNAGLLLSSYHF